MLSVKDNLVPYIGAGFSCPICPGWGAFLDSYFVSVREEFLTKEDECCLERIKTSSQADRFEQIADFLVASSGRGQFAQQLQTQFGQPCPFDLKAKFQLLHRAFPGLKVTTNYDSLIKDNSPQGHVEVARGNRQPDLERLLTLWQRNCLLKIHGGLGDIPSIVLSSQQYQDMYGHATEFSAGAALPSFLIRLFSNSSVLFIGCSLEYDRVLAVLQHMQDVRPHFALMKRPDRHHEIVALNRRLSNYQIKPIWLRDFNDIPMVLNLLLQPDTGPARHTASNAVNAFVGRAEELDQIRAALAADQGGVQMISGRLFNVEGAGGVGKTSLALQAAELYGDLAIDGVLTPFRADELNSQSFAMELARELGVAINNSPADSQSAQQLITALLKDRCCLIILDNAVDWKALRTMLPKQTRSIIIVTTRDRDMGTRLRSHFQKTLAIAEIKLRHFSQEESLNLFRELLQEDYRAQQEDRYGKIARELGFLPIALRQVIALMKYSPHYTAQQLHDKLKADGRLALLRKGRAADDSDERSIDAIYDLASAILTDALRETLEYLAVCAPGPVPIGFLQRLSGSVDISEHLEQLYTYSWCERRESGEMRHYELHQLVRELIFERFGKRFDQRFIDTIDTIFLDDGIDFSRKDALIAQLNEALDVAERNKDRRILDWLFSLYWYCTFRGQHVLYLRLTEIVERVFAGEPSNLAAAFGNRALILKAWGKLDQAMALHQKQEKICQDLGDQAGLAITWWNQGLIFAEQGQKQRQIELWQRSIDVDRSIGIPTEDKEKVLKDLLGK